MKIILTLMKEFQNIIKEIQLLMEFRHDIPTWCNIYNIKQATVNARIRRGWSSINAITTPKGK